MSRRFKARACRRSDAPQQDRLEEAGARLPRGIETAESFRGFLGRGERQAHYEPLSIEQRRRKPIVGTWMGNDADPL